MKIFLTGGTGVIGSRALPGLVAAGHDVTAVARTDGKAEVVRSLGGSPVSVDLFDPAAVALAVTGHEVVIHLATNIPPPTQADGSSWWKTNERLRREASGYLVDGALASGAARYVQESICFPYRDNGDHWIDEDHPVDHVGSFRGAAEAEAATRRFAAGGGAGVVLRFGLLYGAESRHTRAANVTIRDGVNPFIGPPGCYASFIHADDAGAAVTAALGAPSGTYNVVDDEPVTGPRAAGSWPKPWESSCPVRARRWTTRAVRHQPGFS